MLISNNTNGNFLMFFNKVYEIYNRCFPIKTKYISVKRLQNAWLSNGIMKSIKYKCKLFNKYKLGIVTHDILKKYRNILTQVIRTTKNNFHKLQK